MEPPIIQKARPLDGVIGIGSDLQPFQGYEMPLALAWNGLPREWGDNSRLEPERFTKQERCELADYMIDLWQRYKSEIK